MNDIKMISDDSVNYLGQVSAACKMSDISRDVSRFCTAAKRSLDLSNKYFLVYGVTSFLGALTIGSFISDTNENPSNMKTAGTAVVSAFIAQVVSQIAVTDELRVSPIRELDMASLCYDDIDIMRRAIGRIYKISKQPEIVRRKTLSEIGMSEETLSNILAAMDKVVAESSARLNALLILLAVISVSNGVHGYKRNDKSNTAARLGYALSWMCSGAAGFGLSLSQGYCEPLSKKSNV